MSYNRQRLFRFSRFAARRRAAREKMAAEGAAPTPAAVAREIIESDLTETREHDAARAEGGHVGDLPTSASLVHRIRWQRGACIGKGAFAEVCRGVDTGEMLQCTFGARTHTNAPIEKETYD